jgi:hypothetical protein
MKQIVAPAHLILQWSTEIKKFVKAGEVDVIKGIDEYLTADVENFSNRTIVLLSVAEVLNSKRYRYDWRKVYDISDGRRINLRDELIQKYRKRACFVNGTRIMNVLFYSRTCTPFVYN